MLTRVVKKYPPRRQNRNTTTGTPMVTETHVEKADSERAASPAPAQGSPEPADARASLSPSVSSEGTLVPPASSTDADSVASMSDVEIVSSPGSPGTPKSPSSTKKSVRYISFS